jgi:hypothetical protein
MVSFPEEPENLAVFSAAWYGGRALSIGYPFV